MPLFSSLLLSSGAGSPTTGTNFVAAIFNTSGTSAALSVNSAVSWSAKTLPTDLWFDCAWSTASGGFWTMVSGSAGGTATSADGITWVGHTGAGSLPTGSYAIGFNGSYLLAIAVNGFQAYKSIDGITWAGPYTLPQMAHWSKPAWNGSTWCITDNGSATAFAATSPDGVTWTSQILPVGQIYSQPVWNGSVFTVVAHSVAIGATSPDGATWTPRTTASTSGPLGAGLCWSGTTYCAINGAGSVSQTSADGINWTSHATGISAPVSNYPTIAWNGLVFSILDKGSSAGNTSPDGVTWTSHTSTGSLGLVCSNALTHGTY